MGSVGSFHLIRCLLTRQLLMDPPPFRTSRGKRGAVLTATAKQKLRGLTYLGGMHQEDLLWSLRGAHKPSRAQHKCRLVGFLTGFRLAARRPPPLLLLSRGA